MDHFGIVKIPKNAGGKRWVEQVPAIGLMINEVR